MSTSQAHALQVLGEGEGIPQQALAEALGLDKSTTSRLVNQLVERGWVAKSVNPQNRREVQLGLTEKGRGALAELHLAASGRFEAIWTQIPPERRPQVLESLSLLTDILRETRRSCGERT
jgi:DNA-binding MarR family transcriptional regulator